MTLFEHTPFTTKDPDHGTFSHLAEARRSRTPPDRTPYCAFRGQGDQYCGDEIAASDPELSQQHYAEHVEKPFYGGLEEFITSSPVVALVLEGLDVIRVVREMLGATNGLTAAAGTIRGDFSSSRQMNLVHASDGPEAATREINLYFDENEICGYTPVLVGSFRASDE